MAKGASMTDALFTKFEERILSGQLKPGSRFPTQKQIAEDEDVSRTVVREAVARLEAQGFAEARQGSGVYVSEDAQYRAFQITRSEMTDVSDVIRLLEMRLAIESEMAALAAVRRDARDLAALRAALDRLAALSGDPANAVAAAEADSAFHLAIARATKNDYFARFVDFLGTRLVPPRTLYLRSSPIDVHRAYAEKVQKEHIAILEGIERLDQVAARSAARAHMQESLSRHSTLVPAE